MATTATRATDNPATATRGRFVWHELVTTDPLAAQTFYKKVVGWNTSKMEGFDYTFWLAGDTPDTMVGGVMTLPAEAAAMGSPPSWVAYIEVPDADATVAQAVKLGATVLMPAKTMEQAGRFAVLQDPAGAVFAVITSATPPQPETDPAPREFSWHELTTTDQPAAIAFYNELFGWEKKSEFDMGDMGSYYMFGRDRFTYGGIMKKPPEGPGTYWLHYIRVADSADAAAERAQKAGATVILAPMEVPGGDRIAVLTDPQGAMFAVQSK
ncbi:MAG TPA: VOC family protein [Gemmatimonadaceae bacterium]|nr:VOC family protein [Gemmatimonadaceae bacterium]